MLKIQEGASPKLFFASVSVIMRGAFPDTMQKIYPYIIKEAILLKELSFFNDHFYAPGEAQVDIEDRGYQFGDGIYEVTHVYNGKLFAFDRHLARFRRSMREMHIPITYMDEELTAIHNDLIEKSGIKSGAIYFQVTRGTAARAFPFPGRATPNLSMTIRESTPNREQQERGISLTLAEDIRWLRCDIKSLNLLGAVFAKEKAKAEGCEEALLYRKDTGLVTEGASSTFFLIKDGVVWTHPLDHLVLPGVTRAVVVEECAKELGLTVIEKTFTPEFAQKADEAFETSTSLEVTPVIKIGGKKIGSGAPGEITKKIMESFQGLIKKECFN